MIDKIILKNFQSHAYSEVDFSEGINSIVGESDNGKTAIIRALTWVWKNRPTGNEQASHWATRVDKNGNIQLTDEWSVTVVFSEGKYVTRRKDEKGFNGYEIGSFDGGCFLPEETFDKVGVSVPDRVTALFNMEDVNVQNQHDSMFLLSDSGQDVARFFNRLIKLDVGDTALSLAESKKRAAKKEKDSIEKDITELTESINKLEWVDEAMNLVERLELTEQKIETTNNQVHSIEELILNMESVEKKCIEPDYIEPAEMALERISVLDDKIQALDDQIYNITVVSADIWDLHKSITDSQWLYEAEEIIEKIDSLNIGIGKNQEELLQLGNTLDAITAAAAGLKESDYFDEASLIIERIDSIDDAAVSISEEIDGLDTMIIKLQSCEKKITESESRLKKYESEMPETCPLCNSPLKGGSHEIFGDC